MFHSPSQQDPNAVLGVAEGLDLVLISNDELLIQFGLRSRPSELLRDGDLSGLLGRMIGRILRGPATVEELLAEARAGQEPNVRALLGDLIGRGVLVNIRSSPIEQYLLYSFSGEPHIANGRIGLIGAGPLGVRIAQSLLQHGISPITVLDDRPIDAVWRALAPFGSRQMKDGARADVGLAAMLTPSIHNLETGLGVEGIEKLVTESDLVVLALEQPDLRTAHLVNRFAIRERKPWFMATIDGNLGMVGPLFIPVETACYNDYNVLFFAGTQNRPMARKYREHRFRQRDTGSFFPGLPSYAEIVAGHASLAAVHFLLRGSCFALGRVMVIDFDHMHIDVEDVLKLPRCPVCGNEKSAYRPPFVAAL